MNLTKNKNTGTGTSTKSLYTGFTEVEVVAINPTKEERAELFGYEVKEDSKDIEYTGETKEGDDFVTLEFIVKSKQVDGLLLPVRFRITNKEVVSANSNKTQYVNQSGMSTWVDNQENLPKWFTYFLNKNKEAVKEKQVRVALQGEANLYDFLRSVLGKANWWSAEEDNSIFVDKKKMFKNIDKFVREEIRPLFTAQEEESMVTPIVVQTIVYSNEKDGKTSQYQNVYNAFLPVTIKDGAKYINTISLIRLMETSGNWNGNDVLKRYIEQMGGQYGCKDAYHIGVIKPFDASTHQGATNDLFRNEGTAAGTVDDLDY